ncbi:alpha/beta fold hydrolase [Nocardia sp. NPDC056100]|uniref:alpha/beta fold hydrolase n=1 Tax=Nocardia sp. NPDC056100 TaxID=3345712 RepID=UPI0035D9E6B0
MPYINTPDGVRLYYETLGDPAAPPLVLIQGLGGHLLGWHRELCAGIAATGFHVIRFDNRDVGLSQKFPAGGYQLADMAADTAGLLDALGIDSAHIVAQ